MSTGNIVGEARTRQHSPRMSSSHSGYDTRVVRVKKRHQSPKKRVNGNFELENGMLQGKQTLYESQQSPKYDMPLVLQPGRLCVCVCVCVCV